MRTVGILALALTLAGCATPAHLYLTWQGDTSTTMTVNFHTMAAGVSRVYYDTASHDGRIADYAAHADGDAHQVPGLADGRWIHTVELTGLTPGSDYYFAVDENDAAVVRERKFRTLPNDGSPIRFVDGGDVGPLPAAGNLLRLAASMSPYFVEIGGDIAYENGNLARAGTYDRWLSRWEASMVTPEGYTVPGMFAMGNHETNGKFPEPEKNAPFYFGYFAQGGASNFAREIGPNAVLIFLDSGHTQSWEAQVPWLRETLAAHATTPFKMATYHVPLYPSHRAYDGAASAAGRDAWGPLFDEFRLTNAFEHHDHTFKRSKPLRGGTIDPEGTLYLGDGCLGQGARTVDLEPRWYIEKASGTRHFWLVDVRADAVEYQAVNAQGAVFDTVTVSR